MGSVSWNLEVNYVIAVVGVASCQWLLLWVGTKYTLEHSLSQWMENNSSCLPPQGTESVCIAAGEKRKHDKPIPANFHVNVLVRVRTEQHRFHHRLHKPGGEFEYNLKLSPLWSLSHYIIAFSMSSQLQYQCRCADLCCNHEYKCRDCRLFCVGPVDFLSLCYAVPTIFHFLLYKLWISYWSCSLLE